MISLFTMLIFCMFIHNAFALSDGALGIPPGSTATSDGSVEDIRQGDPAYSRQMGALRSEVTDWSKFGEDITKDRTFSNELVKAKYVASEVAKQLAAQGIKPNYSTVTRLTRSEDGTCGGTTVFLRDAFAGAGFPMNAHFMVMGEKSSGRIARAFDPNSNHGATALAIGEKVYSFDIWWHGKDNDTFDGFDKSPWNGIETEKWGKKVNYPKFCIVTTDEEGVDPFGSISWVVEQIRKKVRLVKFFIVDKESRAPIEGAMVSIASIELPDEVRVNNRRSGKDGKADLRELSGEGMFNGLYEVTVAAEKYEKSVSRVNVDLDKKWEYTIEMTGKKKLHVRIEAPSQATVGQTVAFNVVTDPNDPGEAALQYAWRMKGSTQVIEDKKTFSRRVDHPGAYEFSVVVYRTDMVKKQSIKLGEAKHTMVVGQSLVNIQGPAQVSSGENAAYTAAISGSKTDTGGLAGAAGGILSSLGKQLFGTDIVGSGSEAAVQPYIFEWYVDGARMGGSGNSLSHSFTVQGSHTVKVVAYEDVQGKRQKLGEKTVSVNVGAMASPKVSASISGPGKIKRGETAEFIGNHSVSNAIESALYFNWIVDGQAMGSAKSIRVPCQSAGQRTIELELWNRTQSKPIRLSRESKILIVEDQATSQKPKEQKSIQQKSNDELTQAEGQIICECMNNHIQRSYDKPGTNFVFTSRSKYDPTTKICKALIWRDNGRSFSGDYSVGEIRAWYWDNNAGTCKAQKYD